VHKIAVFKVGSEQAFSAVFLYGALDAIGTKRQVAFWMLDGRFRSKAEVNERAASTASVRN